MVDTIIKCLFAFILVAGPLAFLFLVGRWGWQDARERGSSKAMAFVAAALVVSGFPLGLAIWLCLRPKGSRFDPGERALRFASE